MNIKRIFSKTISLLLTAVFLLLSLCVTSMSGCLPESGDTTEALVSAESGVITVSSGSESDSSKNQEDILSVASVVSSDSSSDDREKSATDPEIVAAYIRENGELPDNYIKKEDAVALGWISSDGNLWDVAPGKAIGGNRYGNYDQSLPTASGRKWYECDVNYEGGYRGAERIIYSNDGLIYYTSDHYETFVEMQ